ncbi:hypothetical protein N9157_03770 [Saprospiraceae bacterium]|nr:hypothetical protein [Saprospiraceae bacterium]
MKKFLLLLPIIFLYACKSQPHITPLLQLSKNHKVIFLDSLKAGNAIIKDEMENFFSLITPLDISIQIKKNFEVETSRNEIIKEYKSFLKKDVLNFSKEEMEYVNGVFKEAYEMCNKVSTSIFPKEIKLIKTHANHYGHGAYYTRENCIIIPKDELDLRNKEGFLETMFHEISHIYTRFHPEKQRALYKLIGFSNIGNMSNLLIKEELKSRILLNPDGINFAYHIELKEKSGRPYSAIPIIKSNETRYIESKNDFFNYIDFSLYKISIQHGVQVKTDAEGNSTINMDNVPNFFEKITSNTDYIIHPDEIIADNFMYLMMREKKNGLIRSFSKDGTELLRNIKNILIDESMN